jgi:glutathione S-transferase
MGLPLYIKDQRRDLFSFVDTKLNTQVARGFQAMALDERRRDFPVTRWVEREGIEQVWFSGCHSDVGGGYPSGETGLSDIALDWMMNRLSGEGVTFETPFTIAPDLTHLMQDFHKPWEKPPFNIDPQPRTPERGDAFHPSVRERWLASAPYREVWKSSSLVAEMLQQLPQSKSLLT